MPQTAHHKPVNARMRRNARRMRQSSTDAEAAMWRLLRDRRFAGFKFCRQVPFQNYILDFVCFERRIVIEIDGGQHVESARDAMRGRLLHKEAFRTLRYWNNDVLQRGHSVREDIFAHLNSVDSDPSPGASLRSAPPSPTRGEGESARGEG